MRILLLEDDLGVLRTVARVLRQNRSDEIVETTCCAEARIAEPCDLAIFDVELQDGNGIEVARELLARGSISHVVFFSGSYCDGASDLGPVIIKGDDLGQLLAAVATARAGLLRSRR